MAECAKCKRPLPDDAKACFFCGRLVSSAGTPQKKGVPAPKRSAEEAIFATTTASMAQRKGSGKIFLRIVLVALGLVAILLIGKEAKGLFDGSGDAYRQGISYDPVNGLLWQRSKADPMTHIDAGRYCERSRVGSRDDWRLPTVGELRTIVKGCATTAQGGTCQIDDACLSRQCRDEECVGCGAVAGPGEDGLYWEKGTWEYEYGSTQGYYWSSSAVKDSPVDEVWAVSFVSGGIVAKERESGGEIRCVSGPVSIRERLRLYIFFRE